jgi:hypothetical protein
MTLPTDLHGAWRPPVSHRRPPLRLTRRGVWTLAILGCLTFWAAVLLLGCAATWALLAVVGWLVWGMR